MKTFLLSLFIALAAGVHAQSVIGSVNSGAVSSGGMAYSVGEIYVNPEGSADGANSGLMGVLSRVEFYVGVGDELVSEDLRVLPNPVSNAIFFETKSGKPIEQIFVYDLNGKLALTTNIAGNRADLSALPNGAYLIKTNIDNIRSLKIIKQ